MNHSDLKQIYRQMYRSRIFEEHVVRIWNDGLITGEMHTGIGEEAINAGVVTQLVDGDALALDHRGTAPSLLRGVDPTALLLEFMGQKQGLCMGRGGHMHIFSKQHLLASSGIVGSSGPGAAGFALASKILRPGKIAVAFFGEGAVNAGMLMESFNLTSVLKLPVLFICKDNDMAITTISSEVTAGKLAERARAFNMSAIEINGTDVEIVWDAAHEAIEKARTGEGPTFILAKCSRRHGHFLGDPLQRIVNKPVKELGKMAPGIIKSTIKTKGASLNDRIESLKNVLSLLRKTASERLSDVSDPLMLLREKLSNDVAELDLIENDVKHEMDLVTEDVLRIYLENNQE